MAVKWYQNLVWQSTGTRIWYGCPVVQEYDMAVQWYQNMVWQSSGTRIWYDCPVVSEYGMAVEWYENVVPLSAPKGGVAQVYLKPQSTLRQSSGTRI